MGVTLPETNTSPLKIGRNPKGNSSPNQHFSRGELLNFGGVWRCWYPELLLLDGSEIRRENHRSGYVQNPAVNSMGFQLPFPQPVRVSDFWLPPTVFFYLPQCWVYTYGCFQTIMVPQNGWFIMENPVNKWMIWVGVPSIFGLTPIYSSCITPKITPWLVASVYSKQIQGVFYILSYDGFLGEAKTTTIHRPKNHLGGGFTAPTRCVRNDRWFHFFFSPLLGEDEPILTNIF